jgi:2-polyprenyl-6-methoxyphenol hydroxylase-like FAD-dependent oxidoreductase
MLDRPHRVVIVGGGFGGLSAASGLAGAPVEVTLVDRRNLDYDNRLLVLTQWAWNYFTRNRSARLITGADFPSN